jgi:transposase
MNEALRNAIVERRQAGTSVRGIARELGIARHSVQRVLDQVAAERDGQVQATKLPPVAKRRPSMLDAYEPVLRELLARYPDMTAMRLFEELRGRGFAGKYTILRQRVGRLRSRPSKEPVIRFETAPGAQAQMDYGSYDLDFTQEGRRRVYLFSYLLGYSRRAYLRFVDAQDFTTTIREHVRAFGYFAGVAATCLYDNQKVVVLRHDDDGPIYNPRFLAFATHYGFKPWACKPRRPQTKGKIERRFHFAEISLLNGRTFHTLDHLNEVTLAWLANVADVRVHGETKQTPLERYAAEKAHLIPLPAQPYDTALVLYRSVNAEGFISYRQNFYAAPWRYIGQLLPVRVTEHEVLIYSPTVEEVARHALLPRTKSGQRQVGSVHPGRSDAPERFAVLEERFQQLGPVPRRFLDGLLAKQRQGKYQAQHVLALLAGYERADWLAALERAVRFGAYSLAAVERILAVNAKPKSILAILAEQERQHLEPYLRDDPVAPRPTADYQHLLTPEASSHGPPSPTPSANDSTRGAVPVNDIPPGPA